MVVKADVIVRTGTSPEGKQTHTPTICGGGGICREDGRGGDMGLQQLFARCPLREVGP